MKRVIKSATQFDRNLLYYIPRLYRPYVSNIYKGEKFWNEITKRWNYPVIVEWNVEGDVEEEEFANAEYMKNLLREFGGDVIDQLLWAHHIQL